MNLYLVHNALFRKQEALYSSFHHLIVECLKVIDESFINSFFEKKNNEHQSQILVCKGAARPVLYIYLVIMLRMRRCHVSIFSSTKLVCYCFFHVTR